MKPASHLSHPRYTKRLNWSHPQPLPRNYQVNLDPYTEASIKLNRWQKDGHGVREIARRWNKWEKSSELDDWLRSVWWEVWRLSVMLNQQQKLAPHPRAQQHSGHWRDAVRNNAAASATNYDGR